MADPIIQVKITAASEPLPSQGTSSGGGSGGGGGGGGGGGEDDAASQMAKAARSYIGRRTPGGRSMLDALGLTEVIDDLAGKLGTSMKKIKDGLAESVRDFLGLEKKAQPGAAQPAASGGVPGVPGAAAEGGEAAAAGGGAELLGALGPIGVAVLAVKMGADAIGAAADKAAEGIRAVGSIGADLVRNDPGRVLQQAAHGMINWIDENIPILGKLVTVLPKQFLAISDAAQELTRAFLQRASELAKFSGEISTAEALGDVRRQLADIREAGALGGGLSRVVTLQSQIETNIQDALTPLKQDLLELLIPILEYVREMTTSLKDFYRDAKNAVQGAANFVPFMDQIMAFVKFVKDNWPWGAPGGEEDDSKLNEMMASFLNIDPFAEGGARPPARPPQGLGA